MPIKDFTILAKIGQGAYSSVYKVQRIADQKQYALKKVKLGNLSDKQLQNAVNQIRILASISNPNIISYKEAFVEGKNLCLVMQFANEGDLYLKIRQLKKKNKNFQENDIWNVLIQVTRGLKSLHDLKIFHRDLKSANVFLTRQGGVKLGDMNVSKLAKNGLLFTQTGTPYYASPQVWRDKPYDSKSDIWSFGCVIYQMATLQPPFHAQDMQGLFEAVTTGTYPPIPPFYSKQLSNIIKLMLQQNSLSRPSCDKLLKSALLVKKSKQLKIYEEQQIYTQLLKTIRIPRKIQQLPNFLPRSNYNSLKSNQSILRDRKTSQRLVSYQHRQRMSTLPKLDNLVHYHQYLTKKNKKQSYLSNPDKRLSPSVQDGMAKNVHLQEIIKSNLESQRQDIKGFIKNIYHQHRQQENKQFKSQRNKVISLNKK